MMDRASYSLLLGAGAEVSYGMPSGAAFAAGVFVEKGTLKTQQRALKAQLGVIPLEDAWMPYRKWLGIDHTSKPRVIGVVDKDFDTVIVDGMAARREEILDWMSGFDDTWNVLVQSNLDETERERFASLKPSKALRVRGIHDDRVKRFFESESFRRLIAVLTSDYVDADAVRSPVFLLASVLIGVTAGSSLQGHAAAISVSPLENTDDLPDGMDLSQCVPSLSIQGSSRLTTTWTQLRSIDPSQSGFAAAAVDLGNTLLGLVVDYQQWIGRLYHYLFRPADSFSKFTKAVTFMRSAGSRIENDYLRASKSDSTGYYEDIAAVDRDLRPGAIATTNYTSLIDRSGYSQRDVLYLNGHVTEQFDPYLQRHVGEDQVSDTPSAITIPSLFVQSAVKPFTDIALLHRYVRFHEEIRKTGRLAVVGFGFNADDGHINALVRTVLFEGYPVLVFDYDRKGKEEYLRLLRLERAPAGVARRLVVKPIDAARMSDGVPWLEMVKAVFANG